jgi:2-keto-4-pentenoate hydratase/2-oxohepta-3-ene-1,7-dioic acid hydratase in catechol pathway
MRFARFAHADGLSVGVVEGDVDAGQNALTVAEIEGSMFGQFRFTGSRWAVADVRLFPPPLFSSKIVCVGRNYAEHAAELSNEVPKEPLLFLKPSTSLIGAHDTIELPPQSSRVDHEAELAVVIGGSAGVRRLDRAAAAKAIFGYTVANDVTARDLQASDGQWTRAKGFDTFCPLGPWIETELDVSDLEVRCEVNDEVRQLGSTKDMVFDSTALVSYISHMMTLLPGDVILTGTPAGVSPLISGDVVSVRIAGIGELINPVRARED